MYCTRLLFSCLTSLLCAAAAAEPVPPPEPEENGMQAVSLPQHAVKTLRMGRLDVSLEKTTLKQVRDAIGVGSVEQGDAGASIHWLCYTMQKGNASERLWLIADDAMGGAEQRIGKMHALQTAASRPSPGCPALPRRFLPLRFDRGLWLKQPSAKVQQAFGAPSINADERWAYAYTGKIPAPQKGKVLDVNNRFEAYIKDGAIQAIIASQVSSD